MMTSVEIFPLQVAVHMFTALWLLRAALTKFRDNASFFALLANYQLLPLALIAPVARALPCIEAGIAALLLIPATRRPGALAAASLLLLFAAAITVNLARGRTWIDCGCGRAAKPISLAQVLRNIAMVCILAGGALVLAVRWNGPGFVVGLAAGVGGFLLFLCYETLAAQAARPRRRLAPALRELAWSKPAGRET